MALGLRPVPTGKGAALLALGGITTKVLVPAWAQSSMGPVEQRWRAASAPDTVT
jgi:hypothetical protein